MKELSKEMARKDLVKHFSYSFPLLTIREQRRLELAWGLGYIKGQRMMLNEIKKNKP